MQTNHQTVVTTVVNNIAIQNQHQQQNQSNNQLSQHQQQLVPSSLHVQPAASDESQLGSIGFDQSHHSLSWPCELCGRMFGSREEWTVHAKSHLEVTV